jgi:hypothetical protein
MSISAQEQQWQKEKEQEARWQHWKVTPEMREEFQRLFVTADEEKQGFISGTFTEKEKKKKKKKRKRDEEKPKSMMAK